MEDRKYARSNDDDDYEDDDEMGCKDSNVAFQMADELRKASARAHTRTRFPITTTWNALPSNRVRLPPEATE